MAMSAPFLEQYDDVASGLPGIGVAWLENLRRDGSSTYQSLGLPGPRVEAQFAKRSHGLLVVV